MRVHYLEHLQQTYYPASKVPIAIFRKPRLNMPSSSFSIRPSKGLDDPKRFSRFPLLEKLLPPPKPPSCMSSSSDLAAVLADLGVLALSICAFSQCCLHPPPVWSLWVLPAKSGTIRVPGWSEAAGCRARQRPVRPGPSSYPWQPHGYGLPVLQWHSCLKFHPAGPSPFGLLPLSCLFSSTFEVVKPNNWRS